MKKLIRFSALFYPIFSLLISCRSENIDNIQSANVTFSISTVSRNGELTKQDDVVPSFVLLSISDSHGETEDNIKLALFSFGLSYISENLELQTGTYQLTQFAVLDASNKIIYATPQEGSNLAHYVSDSLPLEFTVTEASVQIIPQVLEVFADDNPETFGYASFGFEIVKPKLKSICHYYYSSSQKPNEKFIFYYDGAGRLAGYDRYTPDDSETGFRQTWHGVREYFPENSSYKETTWEITNGAPTAILSTREVLLDEYARINFDRIYDNNGELTREYIYSRFDGGYSVKIRRKLEEYGGKFGVTKVSYETDKVGNVTRKLTYSSHFEDASDVEDHVINEYTFTHSSRLNPLFELNPIFTDFTSLYRVADCESRNTTVKITAKGNSEDYDTYFIYKYQDGYVTEASPGGLLLYKRTFEYY